MPPEYGHLNRQFNFGKYLQLKGHEPDSLEFFHKHSNDKRLS